MSDGYAGGQIFCTGDNHFYNLDINDNTIAGEDFAVDHNLNINSGTFNVNGKTVEVENEVNIYGILEMTNALDVLICGDEVFWKPGSNDNITAGNIYSASWTFEDGTDAMLGTGNTVHLSWGNSPYDSDAEFGNLIIGPWSKSGKSIKSYPENNTGESHHAMEGIFNSAPDDGKLVYPRRVAGNCTTLSGFGWYSPMDIIVQGTLDIQDDAHQTLTSDNTIYTYSDFTLNGLLDLQDEGNGYVDGQFQIASTGELIIEGGEFIVENASPGTTELYGTLTMTDGLFQIDKNFDIASGAVSNISGGMIRAMGFYAPYPGTFEPTGGIVESSTTGGLSGIDCSNGNYFYNFNLNPTYGGIHLMSDILITNDLNILTGQFKFEGFTASVQGNTTIHDGGLRMEDPSDVLNAGDDPSDEIIWKADATFDWNDNGRINIFGHCTIENGVAENVEADQAFAFVGTGDQEFNNFDDATFGTIELAKPSGALIIPEFSFVVCESYDRISGTLTIDGGFFNAMDLTNDHIDGIINVNDGILIFIQDLSQELYLTGEINILNGDFDINGGANECHIAYNDPLSLSISNGSLSFLTDIKIYDNSTLNLNISGGEISVFGDFYNENTGFQADGGIIKINGNWRNIECYEGYFNDLLINGDVFIKSDLSIHGDLIVDEGDLTILRKEITCQGNVEVNQDGIFHIWDGSTLKLNNGSDIIAHPGGSIISITTQGNTNLITGINTGDYYHFTIKNEGYISSNNTIFENMSTNGIFIDENGEIGNECFENCVFRNGAVGGTLLTINIDENIVIEDAVFESSSDGSTYNVAKTTNLGEVTFTGFSGNFSGEDYENDPFNRIHWFEPSLIVTPSNRNVGAATGTTTFNVTSNIDWTVTEGFDWIDVLPLSGTGDGTLTVNYDENTSVISRMASITVSGDDVPDVVVTVTQAGAAPALSVTPDNQNVSAAAGGTSFDVFSNTSWNVTESVDWLSVAPMSGSSDGTILVSYEENTSVTERIGEITLSTFEVTVTVTQAGTDPILSATPPNQDVGAAAGTVNFSLTSNTSWTVNESVGWLNVSPMSGNNNKTLVASYDENTSVNERIGEITISAAGVPDVMITVTQSGADLVLTVTPSNQTVGASAGNTTFDIESNTSWTVSETVSWLSVNPGSGSGNATLDVSYDLNSTGAPRVGEITVSTDGKLADVVTVTQNGNLPELSAEPGSFDFLAPNGIAFLNVFSNTTWIITADMDWLGLNLDTPSGDQVVQVSVQMNNTGIVRTGEITVETEDGSIEIIIPVTQGYFVEHVISLPAGWSGLSSYALPGPPFIEDVFSGIEDDLVIALTETDMYYPAENVNTISMWEPFSAYKIKMETATDLEIYGSSYPTKTMTIPSGWSMLPIISACDVDVETLFSAVVDNVVMLKDIAGYGVYWPEMGINTIGVLQPGMAYYILTDSEVEITFPPCSKTSTPTNPKAFDFSNPAWPEPQKTPTSHSIYIHPDAIGGIKAGSVLGAFDHQGNCCGISEIKDNSNYIQLFGDDQTTAEKDGFTPGERISFKFLSASGTNSMNLEAVYDLSFPKADGTFIDHGISAIDHFKSQASGIDTSSPGDINLYPNPSSGKVKLAGLTPGAMVLVADTQGQVIYEDFTGDMILNIDLSFCEAGVYMVTVKQQDQITYHKLVIQ